MRHLSYRPESERVTAQPFVEASLWRSWRRFDFLVVTVVMMVGFPETLCRGSFGVFFRFLGIDLGAQRMKI